jgi:carbon storage regulator
MLVLSRKKGDSIVIDGHIRLSVIDVRGNQVRLGVVAPENVRVCRGELPPTGKPAEHVRPPQAKLASA